MSTGKNMYFMPFVLINYLTYFHLQKFIDDLSAENP